MKPQKINITHNKQTGRFIIKEDRNPIKESYPEIENFDDDIPQWHIDIVERRMEEMAKHPERLLSKEEIFKELNRKI